MIYDVTFLSDEVKSLVNECCQSKSYFPVCDGLVRGIDTLNSFDSILANDGNTAGWDFQLTSRSHVRRLFSTYNESMILKERIKTFPIKFEIKAKFLTNTKFTACSSEEFKAFSKLSISQCN